MNSLFYDLSRSEFTVFIVQWLANHPLHFLHPEMSSRDVGSVSFW